MSVESLRKELEAKHENQRLEGMILGAQAFTEGLANAFTEED